MDLSTKVAMLDFAAAVTVRIAPKNILPRNRDALLISYDRLGDLVLLLPFAKAMAEFFRTRGGKTTLLCNGSFVSFAQSLLPEVKVMGFSIQQWFSSGQYRKEMLHRIRAQAFHTVLDPRIKREFFIDDLLVRASGAQERIGIAAGKEAVNPFFMKLGNRFYTRLMAPPQPFNILKNFRQFAETVTGEKMVDLPRLLPDLPKPDLPKPYCVVIPGALDIYRQYPPEQFAQALAGSRSLNGHTLVIVGNAAESVLPERIVGVLPIPMQSKVIDLTGKTDLVQLAAILQHANSVVGNETGTIHLAATVRKGGIVCLLGQGHYGRFLPYPADVAQDVFAPVRCVTVPMPCANCNWRCPALAEQVVAPCIAAIPPDAVSAAIDAEADLCLR